MAGKIKDYKNKIIGKSRVIKFSKLVETYNGKRIAVWQCQCECGRLHEKTSGELAGCIKLKKPNTCGDRMCCVDIKIGERFGRLTVLSFKRVKQKNKETTMIKICCKCDCGKEIESIPNRLKSKATRSCGCLRKEELSKRSTTHGMGGSNEYWLFHWAKARAREQNVPFNLEVSDIKIPKVCPVIGVKLEKSSDGKIQRNSPTLDKIIIKKGYVKGNIQVLSNRANFLKNNGTLKEFEKILEYIKK